MVYQNGDSFAKEWQNRDELRTKAIQEPDMFNDFFDSCKELLLGETDSTSYQDEL